MTISARRMAVMLAVASVLGALLGIWLDRKFIRAPSRDPPKEASEEPAPMPSSRPTTERPKAAQGKTVTKAATQPAKKKSDQPARGILIKNATGIPGITRPIESAIKPDLSARGFKVRVSKTEPQPITTIATRSGNEWIGVRLGKALTALGFIVEEEQVEVPLDDTVNVVVVTLGSKRMPVKTTPKRRPTPKPTASSEPTVGQPASSVEEEPLTAPEQEIQPPEHIPEIPPGEPEPAVPEEE